MRSTYKFHENGATTKSNDPTVYKKELWSIVLEILQVASREELHIYTWGKTLLQ